MEVRVASLLRSCQFAVVLSGAMFSLGCGGGAPSGPPRFDVQGAISFDGQPIQAGEITFVPDTSKGNSGPAANAKIENGRYTTVGRSKGVVGGPHRVRVIGFDGNAKPEEELPFGMPLFPEYEMSFDLPKSATGDAPASLEIAVPKEAGQRKAGRPNSA